ncbi:MAG TPA: HAD family hydrolase [Ignavibacteria bacterium]|nr:HAD family hydrolase [Ignavibacteria bacterium]HMR00507.1 HAD family hydrolase [Ignavibacteria bacterium]
MNKALFLDRDGTIVKEVEGKTPETLGYLLTVEEVELIEGSAEAIAAARKSGYKIIVITNQSAVARGWLSIEELDRINQKMYALLKEANPEAVIDALYYSPYHKDGVIEEYSLEHNSRKPNTGMILEAQKEHNIELSGSWMIGDSFSDMQAGVNAGLHNILVETGYGKTAHRKCLDEKVKIDFIASNLFDAVKYIAKTRENRQ